MLGENPAKLTFFSDKLKQYAYDVQGIDRTQAEIGQPDYMKEGFSIPSLPDWVPIPGYKGKDGLKYLMADLPYADMYNGFTDYLSSFLPITRNFIETFGFHKLLYTGAPVGEGHMVRLGGIFNAPVIRDIVSAMPWAMKGPDGNVYLPDDIENVLNAAPIYTKFRNWALADENRVEQRFSGLVSLMAGVNVRQADPSAAELDFYYNEVQPLLQMYRDMGVTFPTAQQFAKAGSVSAPLNSAVYQPPENGVLYSGAGAAA